jgi:alginate O-acetyltransferase complex protein AlgI
MTLLGAFFLTPFLFLLLAWTLPDGRLRRLWGPLTCLGLVAWAWQHQDTLEPAQRLLACSAWLLYTLKGWSLLLRPRQAVQDADPVGLLLFAYLWPGLDSTPFEKRVPNDDWQAQSARWFVLGFPTMAIGIVGLLLTALHTDLPQSGRGFAAIGCLLLAVHFGFSDVLSSLLRLGGFAVPRLFEAPHRSVSLNDFWTRRWNRPFVEMNRLLFRPALLPALGARGSMIALFLLSGVLHELALSFPAGAGWGGPLAYFAWHGALMLAEKKVGLSRWPVVWARLWTWFWLLAPLPLLFHTPFRQALVLPLLAALGGLIPMASGEAFLGWVMTLAGWGHFLVLVASFQVPTRLAWKEELARLRPLNRKLMWVYGGYIASLIMILGVLTLNLIPEMLRGEKGALAIAGLAALFWWSRVIIDALVFEHSDWPQGPEFVIGHTLLTSLFVTLACSYTSLLLWHI